MTGQPGGRVRTNKRSTSPVGLSLMLQFSPESTFTQVPVNRRRRKKPTYGDETSCRSPAVCGAWMSSRAGDPGRRSSPSLGSRRRRDVLVEAEQVGRVVPILQGGQPLVVLAVGVAHQLLPSFQEAGEVQVVAAA